MEHLLHEHTVVYVPLVNLDELAGPAYTASTRAWLQQACLGPVFVSIYDDTLCLSTWRSHNTSPSYEVRLHLSGAITSASSGEVTEYTASLALMTPAGPPYDMLQWFLAERLTAAETGPYISQQAVQSLYDAAALADLSLTLLRRLCTRLLEIGGAGRQPHRLPACKLPAWLCWRVESTIRRAGDNGWWRSQILLSSNSNNSVRRHGVMPLIAQLTVNWLATRQLDTPAGKKESLFDCHASRSWIVEQPVWRLYSQVALQQGPESSWDTLNGVTFRLLPWPAVDSVISSLQVGSLKGILASANVIEASYVEVVMLSALTNARSPVKSATLSRDILMSSSEAMRSVVAAHLTCHPVASTSF